VSNIHDEADAILADLHRRDRVALITELIEKVRIDPVLRYDEPDIIECVVPFIVPDEPHRRPGVFARLCSFVYTKLTRKERGHAQ
jgi:hypothetical protein